MYERVCKCGREFTTKNKSVYKCGQCRYKVSKINRQANKEKYNAYQRLRRSLNPTHQKELGKKALSKQKCYLAHLISRARFANKKRRDACFEITIGDILNMWDKQKGKCAVTGLLMLHNANHLKSCSIDRIDSTGGYAVHNVQLVCKWVNLAKNSATDNELREVLNEFVSTYTLI